jgi:hypothetical protein
VKAVEENGWNVSHLNFSLDPGRDPMPYDFPKL